MLKQGEHFEGIPSELQVLLDKDNRAKDFFNTLTNSYKKGIAIGLALLSKKLQDRLELKRQS